MNGSVKMEIKQVTIDVLDPASIRSLAEQWGGNAIPAELAENRKAEDEKEGNGGLRTK